MLVNVRFHACSRIHAIVIHSEAEIVYSKEKRKCDTLSKKHGLSIRTWLALLASALGVILAHAAPFPVSNLNNSSAGSLRQAILDANTAAGADTIIFNVSGNASPANRPQLVITWYVTWQPGL
jgi:hypothetical protein